MKTRSFDIAKQFRIGAGLTRYLLKATFRNKAGYFFSLIFPLAFVLVAGLFSNTPARLRLGVSPSLPADSRVLEVLRAAAGRDAGPVELVNGSDEELGRLLEQGKLAGVISRGQTADGVQLQTSISAPQAGIGAASFLRSLLANLSLADAGIVQPRYQLERVRAVGHVSRHIDFILPGQIGFSMLSLATFGIGYNLATLRRTLVLKRMFASSLRPLTFVVAQGLCRSVYAVFQTAVLIAVGVAAFHFTLSRGWITLLQMLVLSFAGILAFIGFGILLSNVSDDEHTLPVLLNLFNLPQVMLAGVFFPIDALPGWLQVVGGNLPLAYLNISLRKTALEGAGLFQLWPYLLGMFAWAALAYVAAARTFRTE